MSVLSLLQSSEDREGGYLGLEILEWADSSELEDLREFAESIKPFTIAMFNDCGESVWVEQGKKIDGSSSSGRSST